MPVIGERNAVGIKEFSNPRVESEVAARTQSQIVKQPRHYMVVVVLFVASRESLLISEKKRREILVPDSELSVRSCPVLLSEIDLRNHRTFGEFVRFKRNRSVIHRLQRVVGSVAFVVVQNRFIGVVEQRFSS